MMMMMMMIMIFNYVCTTADIWTVKRKSYMGMTVHYIKDGEELSRVSAALACRRFMGRAAILTKQLPR